MLKVPWTIIQVSETRAIKHCCHSIIFSYWFHYSYNLPVQYNLLLLFVCRDALYICIKATLAREISDSGEMAVS
jgi:hypothetical protein